MVLKAKSIVINNVSKEVEKGALTYDIMGSQIMSTLNGTSLYITGSSVTARCACGRTGVFSIDGVSKLITKMSPEDKPRVLAILKQYNAVPFGSLVFVKSNANGHNYPIDAPLVKVAVGLCVFSNGMGEPVVGNNVGTEVYHILSANKAFVEALPTWMKKFASELPIEEL